MGRQLLRPLLGELAVVLVGGRFFEARDLLIGGADEVGEGLHGELFLFARVPQTVMRHHLRPLPIFHSA
jgi:hypothetical protein